MHLKVIVILLVLFISSCQCGLLNWFSGLAEEENLKNVKTTYREKRKAEENEIKPDITKSAADKMVFLMDIEKEKLTAKSEQEPDTEAHHGNPKAKRCPRGRYRVSAINPIVGAARQNPKRLQLVKRDSTAEERCNACMSRLSCKLLKKCAQCNEHCKNIAPYTDDFLMPLTNETVGMAHRMSSPIKEDIFQKTLYPVSTFRHGETMDIICRIVGITDTSDIETVTIWVTTFSNTPPKTLAENMFGKFKKIKNPIDQNLGQTDPSSSPKISNGNGQVSSPEIQARFNDDNDDGGSAFSRGIDNGIDTIKANPDVIEGPPPFVSSKSLPSPADFSQNNVQNNFEDNTVSGSPAFEKPIIVQPKEFESDESNEDDDDDDNDILLSSTEPPSSPLTKESTTVKNKMKPTLSSKLRGLALSRTNTLSNIKDRLQKVENWSPARGGLIKNLLTLREDIENPKMTITPFTPTSLQDMSENEEKATAKENPINPIKLPGESNDQIAKINEAIQEVKSMVKNIQEEASKTSEKRLLGAFHNIDTPEDVPQNIIPATSIPLLSNNQIPPILPSRVTNNIKKVNQYFINRAQDALDMIGPQQEKKAPLQPEEVGTERDEHSEIMKNTISNFKKMPQYLLERFKDGLNDFEIKPLGNPEAGVNTSINEASNKKDELLNKFGGDETNKIGPDTVMDSNDVRNEAVVGQPEQNNLESEHIPNIETGLNIKAPTTELYKNKLEKYLAELKENRLKAYTPEKYIKISSINSPLSIEEERIQSTGPSANANTNPSQKELANNLEKQRDLLRQKLKKFVDGVKTKTSSLPTPIKSDESTSLISSIKPEQNDNTNILVEDEHQTLPDLTPPLKNSQIKKLGVPQNVALNIPSKNVDQVVGESNSHFNKEVNDNNNFISATPTISKNVAENPKKLQKYFDDLKSMQLFLLKQKGPSNNFMQTKNQGFAAENQSADKKDLLKAKLKSYVNNLQKPVEETVGQPEISFNQRMADEVSNINNQVKNEMKNLFGPTQDAFKKDLLKDKLRNYVDSLRKPMGSKLVPDLLIRKSSEAQKEELNSLKRKLESLLKSKDSTSSPKLGENPLNFKIKPNSLQQNLEVGLMDKNLFPIISPVKTAGIQDSIIVGDVQHSSMDSQIQEVNEGTSLNNQIADNQDSNFQGNISVIEGNTDVSDWSHSLGKIVQSSTKPTEMFFLGSGIKLPLKVIQGPNGSMDLSVDLEKLCSCNNATCPKNQTAIEETVGAILEKEAELNEQLNSNALDDVKIEPVLSSPSVVTPVSEEAKFNKNPTVIQRLLGSINSKNVHKRKSNIFKRSSDIRGLRPELTTIKNVLEKLKMENEENIKNNIYSLPELPTLDAFANELTDLGKKVQETFTNSVQKLENSVEGLKEELEDKFVSANQNSLLGQNLPTISTYSRDWFQNSLNEIKEKADEINSDILSKLNIENEENLKNDIYNLPQLPTLDAVANELSNLGKNVQDSFTSSIQDLKIKAEELGEEVEDKFMKSYQSLNPLLGQNLPIIPSYDGDWLQNSLNDLKERAEEINNNVLEKLEHKNHLNNLLNLNGIEKNILGSENNIKSLKPDRKLKKRVKTKKVNKIDFPIENPLNIFDNEAKTMNNIIRKAGVNRFHVPKRQVSTTNDPLSIINDFQEKLKNSLPVIPELQSRIDEINDDIGKITDSYQFGKANVLEKKLKQLDNEIQKYYENNEKLLADESKKLLRGHNNEIIEKEVNIINRIISWIKSLTSGINV